MRNGIQGRSSPSKRAQCLLLHHKSVLTSWLCGHCQQWFAALSMRTSAGHEALGQWLKQRVAEARLRGRSVTLTQWAALSAGLLSGRPANYLLKLGQRSFYYGFIDWGLTGLAAWMQACWQCDLHLVWDVSQRPRVQPWQPSPVTILTKQVARRIGEEPPHAWFLNSASGRAFSWSIESRWSTKPATVPLSALRIRPADGRLVARAAQLAPL